MKFVIIPDSFKGSLSSTEAAEAIERGVKSVHRDARTVILPVADGGEGTVDVFEAAGTGKTIRHDVTGPLGKRVSARYILTDEKTAIIEMAQASGLTLIAEDERDPMRATTYGTGELIADALDRGARKILLFVGGSATNDGGAGLAQALGIRLADKRGRDIPPGCGGLRGLCGIDAGGMHPRLKEAEVVVATDVRNSLCGPEGASHVYGPQKGADPATTAEMDGLLLKLANLIREKTGADLLRIPGTGAAGGVAVPLIAFAGAQVASGIDTVLEFIGLDKHLQGADYVLTGEGRIDAQTQYGKVIAGVLKAAAARNVPVVAFCGLLGKGYEEVLRAGVRSCFSILPGVVTLREAMEKAGAYLEDCAKRVARLL